MTGGFIRKSTIAMMAVVFVLVAALASAGAALAAGNSVTVEVEEDSTSTTVTEQTGPTTSEPTAPVVEPQEPVKKPRKKPTPKKRRNRNGSSKKTKSPSGGSRAGSPTDSKRGASTDAGADASLGKSETSAGGPISVPNFFLKQFQIPPFLLPIYQAAGTQYGIRWEILAAINEIETNYGRNLNVSTAGALGWMQFMPATWEMYGVDANNDGTRDPYNPVDAIFAAARYLKAAGGSEDLQKGIFAYNHAQWYVDQVILRAKLIAGVPDGLIDSLTGLTDGHFPVYARSTYSGAVSRRSARKHVQVGQNAARVVEGDRRRNGTKIYSKTGAPVVAVQDAVVKKLGFTSEDGHFIVIQDGYGNRYRYSRLAKISRLYPVPRNKPNGNSGKLAGDSGINSYADSEQGGRGRTGDRPKGPRLAEKERLYAHPGRQRAAANGSYEALAGSGIPMPGYETFDNYFSRPFGLKREDVVLKPLRVGSRVIGGTILGRIGRIDRDRTPYVHFQVRPAGRGAPVIDPKPILDGWKLLESTAIYRAVGINPLVPTSADRSIGQILLMSKEQLESYVLNRPTIELYECGRDDIRAGQIDRRVLALLAYLDSESMHPTVSSLTCGHSYYSSSGNVSEHSTGSAVDIAAINGEAMFANNAPGGLMEQTVKKIMGLQGVLEPHQIISLFDLGGATMAMGNHADHIHVGFQPGNGINASGKVRGSRGGRSVLRKRDWYRVFDRLGEIENPVVPTRPSPYAVKVPKKRGARKNTDD